MQEEWKIKSSKPIWITENNFELTLTGNPDMYKLIGRKHEGVYNPSLV